MICWIVHDWSPSCPQYGNTIRNLDYVYERSDMSWTRIFWKFALTSYMVNPLSTRIPFQIPRPPYCLFTRSNSVWHLLLVIEVSFFWSATRTSLANYYLERIQILRYQPLCFLCSLAHQSRSILKTPTLEADEGRVLAKLHGLCLKYSKMV